MLPLIVDLAERPVVVIGAGRVSAQKVALLLAARARVTIIATELRAPVSDAVESLLLRPYEHGDLKGAFLAVAATGDPLVDDRIVAEAQERGMLLNVVDDAARSNFYFTAAHRDGDVVVSVSTEGSSPALAQWVRNLVATALPKNLAAVARRLRAERDALHASGKSTENLAWMQRVEELVREEHWAGLDPGPSQLLRATPAKSPDRAK
ncbi:MAG: bifunctional precorrin-2 dehydrogenase/sirohydrochlorin ferrochelatase [Acidimicrobiales bacterium]